MATRRCGEVASGQSPAGGCLKGGGEKRVVPDRSSNGNSDGLSSMHQRAITIAPQPTPTKYTSDHTLNIAGRNKQCNISQDIIDSCDTGQVIHP
mmetsp:Transcript_2746/g.5107  ORF Transcript_2746/g.5107 Transcript_2746/m.5107 type:complete len:94 (-) Transcript_2746:208-489(-)